MGARGGGLSARKVRRSRALYVRCDKVRRPLAPRSGNWSTVEANDFAARLGRLMFSPAFVCYALVAVAGFAAAQTFLGWLQRHVDPGAEG